MNVKKVAILITAISGFAQVGSMAAYSQETVPRNVSPSELVTLDRSLPMDTALNILSQYSTRYQGKIIIDAIGYRDPIGVMVNNMYWKNALEYILRSNLLGYVEHEKYFEIVPLAEISGVPEGGLEVSTTTREVEINAIFFEADYASLIEAGIDWSFLNNGEVRVNSSFGSEVTRDLFSVQVDHSSNSWDVRALLRTFESLNKGEVIANPQIKVLDGQEGKIKVGTNFFLTTRDFAGNTRFTEYESGIILTVTPTVIGEGDSMFIHLNIAAERSDVFPDPTAVTKAITESTTQVLLTDGEETVIAGLFADQTTSVRRGIPLLKDLPPWFFGLRYLFGYTSHAVQKTELIIILQARIIPTIAERLRIRAQARNHIEEERREFQDRMKQLKQTNRGRATRTPQRRN